METGLGQVVSLSVYNIHLVLRGHFWTSHSHLIPQVSDLVHLTIQNRFAVSELDDEWVKRWVRNDGMYTYLSRSVRLGLGCTSVERLERLERGYELRLSTSRQPHCRLCLFHDILV